LTPTLAFADEGMWPFNMVPVDRIKKEHNVDVSQQWLLRRRPTPLPPKSIRRRNRAIRLTRGETVAPNRGVIASALLLGIALAVALPGAGLGGSRSREPG